MPHKPGHLNSVPETHPKVKRENELHKVVLSHVPWLTIMAQTPIIHTHTIIMIINNLFKIFKIILQNISSQTISIKLGVVMPSFTSAL